MSYLIVAGSAILIGALGGLLAESLEHVRWLSVAVGFFVGVVSFGLGTTKAFLEILDKRLDVQKKRQEREESNAKIERPTPDEIRKYGGAVYREVTRTAELLVNQRERLESKGFVAGCQEQHLPD